MKKRDLQVIGSATGRIRAIHVTIEGRMPQDLCDRVQLRAQVRALCRGMIGHCIDIASETIGVPGGQPEFAAAIDLGNQAAKTLMAFDGGFPDDWLWDDDPR